MESFFPLSGFISETSGYRKRYQRVLFVIPLGGLWYTFRYFPPAFVYFPIPFGIVSDTSKLELRAGALSSEFHAKICIIMRIICLFVHNLYASRIHPTDKKPKTRINRTFAGFCAPGFSPFVIRCNTNYTELGFFPVLSSSGLELRTAPDSPCMPCMPF